MKCILFFIFRYTMNIPPSGVRPTASNRPVESVKSSRRRPPLPPSRPPPINQSNLVVKASRRRPPIPPQKNRVTVEERSLTSEERSPSGSPTAEQRKVDAAIEKIQASIVESEKHLSHSKTTVSRTWKAQVKAQKQVLENLNATRSKLRDDQKFNHQLQKLRSETIQDCQKTLEHKDLPRIQETQTKIEELVALLKMNKMPELRKWETLLGIFKELDIINQKNTTTLLLTQNVGDAEEAVKKIDDVIEVLTTERKSLQEQLRSNETSLSQKQKESKSSKDRKKKADDALKSHQREAKQEADRVWTKLQRELTSFSKTRRKISFF
jgi:hypothetical protein